MSTEPKNLVNTLEKVIGYKCASNLLQAYHKAQLLLHACDEKLGAEIMELNSFLETALDDIQTMQVMHDLYLKNEELLKECKLLVTRIQAAGITEHFMQDMVALSKMMAEVKPRIMEISQK